KATIRMVALSGPQTFDFSDFVTGKLREKRRVDAHQRIAAERCNRSYTMRGEIDHVRRLAGYIPERCETLQKLLHLLRVLQILNRKPLFKIGNLLVNIGLREFVRQAESSSHHFRQRRV